MNSHHPSLINLQSLSALKDSKTIIKLFKFKLLFPSTVLWKAVNAQSIMKEKIKLFSKIQELPLLFGLFNKKFIILEGIKMTQLIVKKFL